MLSLKQAHANRDLDRNPHRLDHRRADPVALGRRAFVLFGAVAERRRRFCRAVGRLQDVDLTEKLLAANECAQARLWQIASVESRHATALNLIKVSKRLSQASHCQTWRISTPLPRSANSGYSGSVSNSPQRGQAGRPQ